MSGQNHRTVQYLAVIFVLITSITFLLGLLAGERLAPARVVRDIQYKTVNVTRFVKTEEPLDRNDVLLRIPAVDMAGDGVLAGLSVTVRAGEGLILVDVNDVLADFDTQLSARTAAQVASAFTSLNIDDLDIIYKINAESPLVSGTSAGAAMSIATIAALLDKDLKDGVIITGTIGPDGSIGRVGGILAKAETAKEYGITVFLVPSQQSRGVMYREERKCTQRLGFQSCTVNYVPVSIDVGAEVGLDLVEVRNIVEASDYFFN